MSPDQAQLLAMLVEILGAKRCIEVGVYTVFNLFFLLSFLSIVIYVGFDFV